MPLEDQMEDMVKIFSGKNRAKRWAEPLLLKETTRRTALATTTTTTTTTMGIPSLPVANEVVVELLESSLEAEEEDEISVVPSSTEEASIVQAKVRLAWGLAHSCRGREDYSRAKDLTTELLCLVKRSTQKRVELMYLKAVATYNLGDLQGAEACVDELLAIAPRSTQGLALRDMIRRDMMRKRGAVGGAIATAAAFGAAVASLLAAR